MNLNRIYFNLNISCFIKKNNYKFKYYIFSLKKIKRRTIYYKRFRRIWKMNINNYYIIIQYKVIKLQYIYGI